MPDGGIITHYPSNVIPKHSSDTQPVDLPVSNALGQRSAQAYTEVLECADVHLNDRYRAREINGKYTTFCNFFVWDITRAMGCEIPHQYDLSTGEPVSNEDWDYPNNPNHKWMTANDMVDWLRNFGAKNGWNKITPEKAIELANQGFPVTAVWRQPRPGYSGHVAMVAPEQNSGDGLKIYQAGGTNYEYVDILTGFRADGYGNPILLEDIEFYWHI